ncbi:hypothetical protein L2E82_20379 [Cichorium intybus]|uniref:Uncharacterized protein n=1 Tax=Cichorium intybus TaxID=13427 RepID=A0ACB9DTX6_CICIN|nr:hypothetical protein L2E82_20379 [Cichorium intybus]
MYFLSLWIAISMYFVLTTVILVSDTNMLRNDCDEIERHVLFPDGDVSPEHLAVSMSALYWLIHLNSYFLASPTRICSSSH